jgi:hypothetical protein
MLLISTPTATATSTPFTYTPSRAGRLHVRPEPEPTTGNVAGDFALACADADDLECRTCGVAHDADLLAAVLNVRAYVRDRVILSLTPFKLGRKPARGTRGSHCRRPEPAVRMWLSAVAARDCTWTTDGIFAIQSDSLRLGDHRLP